MRQWQKEWKECIYCGVKNIFNEGGWAYCHSAIDNVQWTEGEIGCGKDWKEYCTYRCECGQTNYTEVWYGHRDHLYEKKIYWDNIDVRQKDDGSEDLYHYWEDTCLACGDVRDSGYEFEETIEP